MEKSKNKLVVRKATVMDHLNKLTYLVMTLNQMKLAENVLKPGKTN